MSERSPSGPVDRDIGRLCTCHPDDKPPNPCAQKYALTECRAAELDRLRAENAALGVALQDMGVMMRRLVWLGRKHCPALVAWERAAELLHKHRLQGQPLRDAESPNAALCGPSRGNEHEP